jgi:hypothetical protein
MNKTVFLYAISAISLLALANFYPKIASFLVAILILGVLAQHGDEYAKLLDSMQGNNKK